MTDPKSFGQYIKKLRESRGYSINQLALYSGVSAAHISRVERGLRDIPSPEFLKKLASGLKVPYEDLMEAAGYLDDSRECKLDNDSSLRIFSHRLYSLREKRGMTLEALAERVGVTPSYLHKLETNPSRFPGVSTLQRLAETLGVTAAFLVGDVSDPNDRGPLDAWYQPKDLVKFLDDSEMVMFDGRPLTEEDKQMIKDILAAVFMDAKHRNKRKK
ncbi:MAG TPA: helix-turn-helix domain-containing protein [Haloplasmataceae bacterium]